MSRASVADILCIGAQRSMTSWLHRVISAHPSTWAFPNNEPVTSTAKEAHYWDWNHHRGETWYRVLMRPLDDQKLSLDFTPDYAFLNDDQIADCKRLNPSAKLIYILRDPLARAVSAVRMHTMWATNSAAADAHTIEYGNQFLERCKNARLWEHGAYAENVARWRKAYPDMLLLNFEDLVRNPLDGARKVFEHCDLSLVELPDATRAVIETRARAVVWQTKAYPLDDDCLNFLHGMTWRDRQTALSDLEMSFSEGSRLMEQIS